MKSQAVLSDESYRTAFERWAEDNYYNTIPASDLSKGQVCSEYASWTTDEAWKGWQAAMQSPEMQQMREGARLLSEALNVMVSASHPSYIADEFFRDRLIKARDIAFKALETSRLNAKEV